MKRALLIFIIMFSIIQNSSAQKSSFILKSGVRINPMIVIDSHGKKKEFTRLHTEIGALLKQKIYLSFGYTPYIKSVYTFNEYWFSGFDSSFQVSVISILEHNFEEKKVVL